MPEFLKSQDLPSKLTSSDLNPNVIAAKYAVRGRIPAKAEELKKQLAADPSSLPFKKVINANIGNPQALDQKPLTFYRRCLALLECPQLAEECPVAFPADVIQRTKTILAGCKSVGAYSNSQGVACVRDSVAKYITKRDGFEANADDVYLTVGASGAVAHLINLLSVGPSTGFLIPIPQYPLYTATIALHGTTAVPYYLKEENDWSIDPKELITIIENSLAKGITPRCLVVINPGNPTGAILSRTIIAELLTIAAKYGIFVIADEVYQENVYKGEFVSFKHVLKRLQAADKIGFFDHVQLASLHSTSKGLNGECGQRGGYMELYNADPALKAQVTKLASINLCSPVVAQGLVDLMVQPPQKGDESFELDQKERKEIYTNLSSRAEKLYKSFNSMTNVTCRNPQGAMYCFPKLDMPQKAIDAAEKAEMLPDEFYCQNLLESTGICTVPGSGFGQVQGTHHLRTTFLAPGTEWIDDWKKFNEDFMAKYAD